MSVGSFSSGCLVDMNWENILKDDWKGLNETISVGDYIETSRGGLLGSKVTHRKGIITGIKISMEKNDIAGEYPSGVEVQQYDLGLGYQGSVSYGDNFWTYFPSITKVVKKEDLTDEELN